MPRRSVKERIYEQLARVGKAVASGRRLELLEILAQGERTVEKLAKETALSVANASHHLHVLRDARLVDARKKGLYVHYRLADSSVYDLLRLIRDLGERRLSELNDLVATYLTARGGRGEGRLLR